MKRVLILSPHLDDAVLSAGQFLASRPDTIVATIFAGIPRNKDVCTTYDAKCGFKTAEEAMKTRQDEDKAAMALLAATPLHLGFIDSQYGKPTEQAGMAKVIGNLIEEHEPEYVVGPLGLVHPDHILVRNALLEATDKYELPVWLYEDLPSRVTQPDSVHFALEEVREQVFDALPGFIGSGSLDAKMSALWCYRSQMGLPEFENIHQLLVGERFWQVIRREGDG
jgi:LmbE family N-acetylglucosaminyl deacetylase